MPRQNKLHVSKAGTYTRLALYAALLICAPLGAEVYKWVDEKGKVHFGDRVPTKYSESAETLESTEAPLQGLSEEEIAEQERKNAEYQRSVQSKSRASEQDRTYRQPVEDSAPKPTPEMTREDCRNAHPSKVKARVECFQRLEESQSNAR